MIWFIDWPIYNIEGKTCVFWIGVMFIWFRRMIENWAERAWRGHLSLPHSILNTESKMRFYLNLFPEAWPLFQICILKHCTNENRALAQSKGCCEDICDFCVQLSWWVWPEAQPKSMQNICHPLSLSRRTSVLPLGKKIGSLWVHLVSTRLWKLI